MTVAGILQRFDELSQQANKLRLDMARADARWVLVGEASCGLAAGAGAVEAAFQKTIAALDLDAPVFAAGCLGHCYAEPLAVVKGPGWPPLVYHHLNDRLAEILAREFLTSGTNLLLENLLGALEPGGELPTLSDYPRFGREARYLLSRSGLIEPHSVLQCLAHGGWRGLLNALILSPEEILDRIERAGLRGLGGAGFTAARKWRAVHEQSATPRYVVANGDEGDPGAYMDRTLLESDPQAVLEGMAVAGLVVGAEEGFLYIRAEYPLAVSRARKAIEEAERYGLLGENILGSGRSFLVHLVQGAGAFVCGEETALLASIEGRRGEPRPRPPYPAQAGLYGKPTLVNNVKTLAAAARIAADGPEPFLAAGAKGGTVLFALAGKAANAGLVEVPRGTTLRQVIFDICGGVEGGRKFRAVQIGGPSGACLPESLLDTPVDFETLASGGAILGSGGLVVLDENDCLVETARYFMDFCQKESCGKCTFCRIGTRQMLDILERITRGQGNWGDLKLLDELARDVATGSLCNLGRTAPNPVLSVLRYFRDELLEHIEQKYCRAGVCEALTAYYILPEKCARGCDVCVGSCPTQAIFTSPARRIKVIDQALCTKCDSCRQVCPPQYHAVVKISPLERLPPSEPRPAAEEKSS